MSITFLSSYFFKKNFLLINRLPNFTFLFTINLAQYMEQEKYLSEEQNSNQPSGIDMNMAEEIICGATAAPAAEFEIDDSQKIKAELERLVKIYKHKKTQEI